MKKKWKYKTCLKNEHYKIHYKANKGNVLCVLFYAIFAKKCEKKGAKQAFTFKF